MKVIHIQFGDSTILFDPRGLCNPPREKRENAMRRKHLALSLQNTALPKSPHHRYEPSLDMSCEIQNSLKNHAHMERDLIARVLRLCNND